MLRPFVKLFLLGTGAVAMTFLAAAADPPAKKADPKAKLDPKLEKLARQLKSPTESERVAALQAITALGQEGAPLARMLCELAADPKQKFYPMTTQALAKTHVDMYRVIQSLHVPDGTEPQLAADFQADTFLMCDILGRRGEPLVPVYLAHIKDTLANKKRTAVGRQLMIQKSMEALATIAPEDPQVHKALFDYAGAAKSDPVLRGSALRTLAALAVAQTELRKRVVPLVTSALEDSAVRAEAVEAAGRLGASAPELIASLKKLDSGTDPTTRPWARWALAEIEDTADWTTDAKVARQVRASVAWLARNQHSTGCWTRKMVPYHRVVTASFAALALMASEGPFPLRVDAAAEFVQDNILALPTDIPGPNSHGNWSLSIGGLFLSEYYAAQHRRDPRYRNTKLEALLQQIVDEACKRMEPSGGWSHHPRWDSALGYRELEVVSNWMLAMLGSAKRLGLKVPEDKVKQAVQFVQDCCNPGSGAVGYSPRPGQKGMADPCRTGGALFAFRLLGLENHSLYGPMTSFWKTAMKDSAEGHGSIALDLLSSGLGARQVGSAEWRAFQDSFFPRVLGQAQPNGTIKFLTGTTANSQGGFDERLDKLMPGYNTGIYALLLQLDRGNLRFLGQKPN